jgi:predicted alpha/beta hydrolase family esterase
MRAPDTTFVIVPGLRDHAPLHWQTLLAERHPQAVTVPPLGRDNLDCAARVQALAQTLAQVQGPVTLVAHSGGCLTVAHWARGAGACTQRIQGALLAVPADMERPLPAGYPAMDALEHAGWLPMPRQRLPFRSIVAMSDDDPLGEPLRIRALAAEWGSRLVAVGAVGHLNPASGFGPWPQAEELLAQLAGLTAPAAAEPAVAPAGGVA